jgi:hypothetical protein
MLHTCVQRFDVTKRKCKNLEFGIHLNKALAAEVQVVSLLWENA